MSQINQDRPQMPPPPEGCFGTFMSGGLALAVVRDFSGAAGLRYWEKGSQRWKWLDGDYTEDVCDGFAQLATELEKRETRIKELEKEVAELLDGLTNLYTDSAKFRDAVEDEMSESNYELNDWLGESDAQMYVVSLPKAKELICKFKGGQNA